MDDESYSPFSVARTTVTSQRCSTSKPKGEKGVAADALVNCDHLIELFCIKLSDALDHPAIWATWTYFLEGFPVMPERLASRLAQTQPVDQHYVALRIGHALCRLQSGDGIAALADLELLASTADGSPLLTGVLRHFRGRLGDENRA